MPTVSLFSNVWTNPFAGQAAVSSLKLTGKDVVLSTTFAVHVKVSRTFRYNTYSNYDYLGLVTIIILKTILLQVKFEITLQESEQNSLESAYFDISKRFAKFRN